jgi:hypothetical protein
MLAKEDILRAEELGDDNAAAINVLRGGVFIPHKLAAALTGSCQITEPEMLSPVALGIETACYHNIHPDPAVLKRSVETSLHNRRYAPIHRLKLANYPTNNPPIRMLKLASGGWIQLASS